MRIDWNSLKEFYYKLKYYNLASFPGLLTSTKLFLLYFVFCIQPFVRNITFYIMYNFHSSRWAQLCMYMFMCVYRLISMVMLIYTSRWYQRFSYSISRSFKFFSTYKTIQSLFVISNVPVSSLISVLNNSSCI